MYKTIKQYDRLQRRKFRQARELHKKLLVLFLLAVAVVILGLKMGEILTFEYCENRAVGQVSYEQVVKYCIPGDGLSHRKYEGTLKDYPFYFEPSDIQGSYNTFQETRSPQ